MSFLQNISSVIDDKHFQFVFYVERLNNNQTFAFTNSNYLINYNLSLLHLANKVLIKKIDFKETQKVHFLNLGQYIIVLKVGSTLEDLEQFFIDYQLPDSSLMLLEEIFSPDELGVIFALKQKMVETYTEKEELIAGITSIYN